jgi:hypothetical protein
MLSGLRLNPQNATMFDRNGEGQLSCGKVSILAFLNAKMLDLSLCDSPVKIHIRKLSGYDAKMERISTLGGVLSRKFPANTPK